MGEFPFPTKVIKEGETLLVVPLAPVSRTRGPAAKSPVFYNPDAALGRDLSLLALKAYASGVGRPVSVADPLTGLGARALRYAREGPEKTEVSANDLSRQAVALAEQAAALNGVEKRVSLSCMDARVFLLDRAALGKRFDFIDLDPFGSPAPFLQSAVSALKRGGVLALAATDSATLSGVYPRTCLARYWARPLKTEYHHEVAARILMGFIARTLASQGLGARPLSAHRLGYALRLHVQAKVGSTMRQEALSSLGYLFHCFRCLRRALRPGALPAGSQECGGCGRPFSVAGPLWTGALFDVGFCAKMLETATYMSFSQPKEAFSLLAASLAEAQAPPTYFVPAKLGAKLKRPLRARAEFAAEIKRRGYSFVETHFETSGFRTDAPVEAILGALSA